MLQIDDETRIDDETELGTEVLWDWMGLIFWWERKS